MRTTLRVMASSHVTAARRRGVLKSDGSWQPLRKSGKRRGTAEGAGFSAPGSAESAQ